MPGEVWLEGGAFVMGSNDFYVEERPERQACVDCFWIDTHPVTVAEYRRFIDDTGYVTVAERRPNPADYPDALPHLLVPGSAVFRPPPGPVDLTSLAWWSYIPGACWHSPEGPGSAYSDLDDHPATHVCLEDAATYAAWTGKDLPTEAEWEFAARGGLHGKRFAWGDDETRDGAWQANTWQGEFPWQNLELDGYARTSPVGAFPANGFGLYDMIGNVWEWTKDEFTTGTTRACCAPQARARTPFGQRVIKGGSHLCAPNYCLRYRPAARQPQSVETGTSHLGFRCVRRRER
jgi:formylglycine-generating enzyme